MINISDTRSSTDQPADQPADQLADQHTSPSAPSLSDATTDKPTRGQACALRLRVEDLVLTRGAASLRRAFSFECHAGWIAVIGGNGVGKSTLMLSLAGLLRQASGRVFVAGSRVEFSAMQALTERSEKQRAQLIAWMGQSESISGRWLVAHVLALGRLPWGDQRDLSLDANAAPWIEALGLETLWRRSVDQLSGGELQRVLIGRALAVDAPVVLLDEPSLHLDPRYQLRLSDWLGRSASRKQLVLTATHDLNWALSADAVLLLSNHRAPLLASPGDEVLHRAIESEMGDAIEIRKIQHDADMHWYALTKRTVIRK